MEEAHEILEMGVPGKKRWGWRIALLSALTLVFAIIPASRSFALDGFASNDGRLDGSPVDWNDFAGGAKPDATWDALTTVPDQTGNPDDIFSGGVKQDDFCAGTGTGSLGGGNSKFDIERLYLTHHKSSASDTPANHDYLFLAWERVPQNSTTASAHIGYEFNRGKTLCSNGDGLYQRTAGDKLLVYDFEGGNGTSTSPSLKLLTWVTSGSCEVASHSPPCWGSPFDLTAFDSKVDTSDVDQPNADAISGENMGVVQFGEAGIDLSSIPGVDVCAFAGHVTGVARSSGDSGTAQMKDKVGPHVFNLPACVSETTITSKISLDDHATIAGFDANGTSNHDGSLTFTLYGPTDTNCNRLVDSTEVGSPPSGTPVDPVYTKTISNIDSGTGWSTAAVTAGIHTVTGSSGSSYKAETAGTYNWVVSFTGDTGTTHNTTSHSLCGDEKAVVSY